MRTFVHVHVCTSVCVCVSSRGLMAKSVRVLLQYRDEKCTEKIDIYSLAMMIWEMLTSQLPWDGSNFQVPCLVCVCVAVTFA
jgi:serine/threonine protein kinase